MPISREQKARYPADWPAIRARILERAKNCCERCGCPNGARIVRRKADPAVWEIEADLLLDGSQEVDWDDYHEPVHVVLTTAHYPDPSPENCDEANLLFLCQLCHNRLDASLRTQSRKRSRDRCAGQGVLIDA